MSGERYKAIAGIILYCLAPIGMSLLPLLVGAATETFALSEKQAGWLATADYAGIAVAAIMVSTIIRKVSWRLLAGIALVPLVFINLFSITITDFSTLVLARFLTEFGTGIIFSLAIVLIGDTRSPGRNYAVGIGLTIALSTLFFLVLPNLIDAYGMQVIFQTHAALSLLIMPALIWIPNTVQKAENNQLQRIDREGLIKLISIFVAFSLFTAAEGAIWAYLETLGNQSGFSDQAVGRILAVTQIAGVVAALFAAWLSTRIGRSWPMLGGLAVFALGSVLLTLATPVTYMAGAIITQFIYIFLVPYYLLVCVETDVTKRYFVLSTPFKLAGFTLGPALISLFIQDFGQPVISIISVLLLLASAVCLIPLLINLDRQMIDKGNIEANQIQ